MTDIPIIDITSSAGIGHACRETGFFYAVGHAIPEEITAGIFDAARRFFALPIPEKDRLSIARSPHNRGYVGLGREQLDRATSPDQKEAFNIGLELSPDDPDVRAGKLFRGVNLWPGLRGWRNAVLAYYQACTDVTLRIHRAFAVDLGLHRDFFTQHLNRPMSTLRLLRYPPGPNAGTEFGAGSHTDYGNLTILATDGIAGLQIRGRNGIWIDAPHIAGAVICNIGDMLMRWTNGIYVSTPHRVVRPTQERYSVAYFADPNPDALVEVLPTCIQPGSSPAYQPVTAGAYLASRLDDTYDHRKASKTALP